MKKPKLKCATPFCRRARGKKKQTCDRCHARECRARNPMWAQWRRLKDKAKARGINFCLPFAYFKIFAEKSEYLARVGNEKASLTVDRINNLLGYVVGNIQPLTREENRRKQWLADERRHQAGFSRQSMHRAGR
jgi:hypothetical protein